jgi:PAS domain S-box-containing protein
MRILVVEDDELTANALAEILSHQNYVVEIAADGEMGWNLAQNFAFDLVLLDVMIPKLDGLSLCRKLRSTGYRMPILLLTGRDSSHDKTIGLDAGADDYVVKPFDPEELAARVRALLRRGNVVSQPVLKWDALRLDPSTCEATYAGNPLSLTPKEYALLELFLRNPHRVFSCGVILEQLWSFGETPGEEAVRTHIKGLRQKLKAVGAPADLVETVYGIGYRLKPERAGNEKWGAGKLGKAKRRREGDGEKFNSSSHSPTQPSTLNPQSSSPSPLANSNRKTQNPNSHSPLSQQQTLSAIAQVWERFQVRVQEQITGLDQAIEALANQALSLELQQQAEQDAHTLAGSLGTFGFPQASKLARELEQLLHSAASLESGEIKHLRELAIALRQEISQSSVAESNFANQVDGGDHCLLLVVDGDCSTTDSLIAVAPAWGLDIETAETLVAARALLAYHSPRIVLLDLAVAQTPGESLALLAELGQRQPPIPVVVFTAQDELRDRLEVTRLGGQAFLHKPLPPEQVMEVVSQVLQRAKTGCNPVPAEARILVVDDDPQILAILQTLLEPWGFRVIPLRDPRRFWDMLETTVPDLLILDIKMPHINGVELCQVVRNDPRWSGLPVFFLTAHSDANTVHQVFAAGADDFITKPIVGPELVTRIINRLDRIKYLRRLAEANYPIKNLNRLNEAQFAGILEIADDAIISVDANQQITLYNRGAEKIFGYMASEVLHQPLDILLPSRFAQAHRQHIGNFAQSRDQARRMGERGEIWGRRKDGTEFPAEASISRLHVDGKPVFTVILRDISDRKQAEQQLAHLSHQNELILNAVGEGLCGLDLDGNITFVNPAATRMLGCRTDDLLHQPIQNILPVLNPDSNPDSTPCLWEESTIDKALRDGTTYQETNSLFRRCDGSTFLVEYIMTPMQEQGTLVGGVLTFKDVSDRQLVERLKDEFVSIVSHELRTPLTSIHGSLGLLASGLLSSDSEKGKRLLQIAVESTDRLMRLINDILDIERIESGKITMNKQVCNAADLMHQATDVMQSMADQFGITLSVSPLPVRIWVDPDRMMQTLTNLLSNAIKFSPCGSTVLMRAEMGNGEWRMGNGEMRETKEMGRWGDGENSTSTPLSLLISVSDRGRGIPTDKLNAIFERFQQVDASDSRNHDGTGLGLAICRSIVQQHGGKIWVESTLGEGSTFYFTLPVLLDENPDLSDASSSESLVLVCDDDANTRAVLQTMLEGQGYRVLPVASGQEAIAQAVVHHPNVILLDLLMPEMNGWEVMAVLKEREDTRNIPIVICSVIAPTGKASPHSDFVDWLGKPLDEASLLHSLRHTLAKSSEQVRVLVVEDDVDLAQVLITHLEQQGIKTLHAATGREAIRLSQQFNPDLLILDLILPDRDGFAVVEWLQQHSSLQSIPLVVYSAKDLDDSERDRLKLGQTEFLTKGRVSVQEFEQRVMELLQPITQNRTKL